MNAPRSIACLHALSPRCGRSRTQWSWQPADWLDILEPPLLLLGELLERFQQPNDREVLAEVAPRLTATLAALYDRHVGGGGGGNSSGVGTRTHQCSRARRTRMTLRAIQEQLTHGQARVRILDEQEAAQRRTADAAQAAVARGDRAAAERLRDPNYLPGSLRPSGRRHDNDHEDFHDIQVVPTCEELLCSEWPYLPSNRPGSMPHLAHDPHRARLEINFRLLRHDVVAPLASALQKFRKLGGLGWLQQSMARQQQRAAAAGRLELEGGSQLFVFRRVRVAGIAVTRQEGAYVKVTFDQPAMSSNNRSLSPEEWWRNSKRLSHGTLLCFWWEPASAPSNSGAAGASSSSRSSATAADTGSVSEPAADPAPRLVVGVVARRDPKELAGKDSPDKRPMVGIRLVQPADYGTLLGAWLDWEGDPVAAAAAQQLRASGQWRRQGQQQPERGGSEVVLVQEHNSFFAYEPVLRALQAKGNIPLAQYIAPGADVDANAADAAADADANATDAAADVDANAADAAADADADADTDIDAAATGAAVIADPTGGNQQAPSAPSGAQLPAYWLDSDTVDLRYIADRDRVLALPGEEQVRVLRVLAAVRLSRPVDQFPLEELLAASTLDRSQAEALRAALAQEVAVVQGPPGTGKTFLGVTLARVLLRNTRSCVSQFGVELDEVEDPDELELIAGHRLMDTRRAPLPSWIRRNVGPEAAAAPPPAAGYDENHRRQARLPTIGPLLVVCFTNHALDSFLEGLLDNNVTSSIVRVGGSSRSTKLEKYNLRNLQSNASGFEVRDLLARAKEMERRAEALSANLHAAADSQRSPLTCDELEPLVLRHHPNLYASFRRGRRAWNRKHFDDDGDVNGGDGGWTAPITDLSGLIDADGGRWEAATGRRRNQKRAWKQHSDLISNDWLKGDPVQDWRRRRVVLESERQQATAAMADAVSSQPEAPEDASGMIQDSDEDVAAGGNADNVDAADDHDRDMEDEPAAAVGSPDDDDAQQQPMALPPPPALDAIAQWLTAVPSLTAATAGATAGATAAATLTPAQMAFAAVMARLPRMAAPKRRPQEAAAADDDGAEGCDREVEAAAALPLSTTGTEPPPPPPPAVAVPAQELPGWATAETTPAAEEPTAMAMTAMTAGAPLPRSNDKEEVIPEEVVRMQSRCRPLGELLASDDVWSMSRQERQLLHAALRRLRFASLLEDARTLQDEYDSVQNKLRVEFDQSALKVLRSARVVGITTSGVARHQSLVAAIKPRVLLVEEAAEVFEAHVLVCLSRSVEHLILIGDHEQLRPKPNEYDLQAASGRGLDLDVSLFERLVRQGAPAAGGRASTHGSVSSSIQIATLLQQRRMRPQISQLIRLTIYPQLRDHPRVLSYPTVRGLASPLFFLDHDHPEGGGGGASGEDRSKKNDWEAQFVVALAKHLLLQGYKPEDLVILVPYVGQLFRVHRALDAVNVRVVVSEMDREQMERAGLEEEPAGEGASGNGVGRDAVAVLPATPTGGGTGGGGSWAAGGSAMNTARRGGGIFGHGSGTTIIPTENVTDSSRVVTMREGVRVATVDNFQGEEATIVLLSTVRNNPDGHIGFLSHRNRVNVMLSRARHGMVVLGNAATLRAAAGKLQRRRGGGGGGGGVGDGGGGGATMWAQVLDIMEHDGCVGRSLRVRCANHGTDTEISEPGEFGLLVGDGGCQMPCGDALPCGHSCPRRCHADDRGHNLVVCTRPCARLLQPCGHPCDKTCGEKCGRCERVVEEEVELPCGHSIRGIQCWKRFEEGAIECRIPVEVALPGCGHVATVTCHDAAAARAGQKACAVKVDVEMPACGHTVRVACNERARVLEDPTACPQQPCGALLDCGHECGGRTCGGCVKRILLSNYQELLIEGWLRSQAPETILEAWNREQARFDPRERDGDGSTIPSLRSFINFISDAGPGAAYRASFMSFLKVRLPSYARSHERCTRPCEKTLVCGHHCLSKCHLGEPCGSCRRPCWISCPHHALCRKPCGEPCVPCSEACDWACQHIGRCRAPCGAPCERLPCDLRCSQLLSCGHRCPGLCGDPCPPAAYCVHPDCLSHATDRIRNQMVDQVMLRCLGELTPEDVDQDPLVVLPPCGHAFLTSTLDGLLAMSSCYERDPSTGAWLRPAILGPDPGGGQPVKTCPQCRCVVRSSRYKYLS
ncbi:hypothetical protein Vretimale_19458 [Volvox reticuliferus]|uniref:NF-X1-type domain-containing protein n=1 Tax=Volvox reticuliferus TaxID=1737510 RepID=A0A8J4GWT3_9CHLO|nr:hypothetical protein Vretimale_19458 [Volvox reticuliferus]